MSEGDTEGGEDDVFGVGCGPGGGDGEGGEGSGGGGGGENLLLGLMLLFLIVSGFSRIQSFLSNSIVSLEFNRVYRNV